MKKLEKMAAVTALVVGGSLLGLGFYKNSQLMKAGGVLSLTYPIGMAMRKLLEEEDRRYFEEQNKISPR